METIEISPFFALDAEELLRDGSLAEALDLCTMGVSAYPDYPAGYCVLADIYWESRDYEKSYEILERASHRFPGNKAVSAKIELFSIKVREITSGFQDDTVTPEVTGYDTDPTEGENFELLIVDEPISENEGTDISTDIDDLTVEEDINPLLYRKSFIRDLPFDANSYRKNDLLRARNLSLIPGLESSPLISSNNRELSRNYIEDFLAFPEPSSESLSKVKQLKLRNNQQSNIDYSIFNEKWNDDDSVSMPDSPVMTETLAKIYESQQLWATAISAYEILSERNPDNAELYQQKIIELRKKL